MTARDLTTAQHALKGQLPAELVSGAHVNTISTDAWLLMLQLPS
jgi:hypothetical protein